MNNLPEFLSFAEVAALRGISLDTVRRMIKRGELTAVQLSPGRKGVRRSEAVPQVTNREHAAA
jgi:excisionase family DNA binding protein